MIVVDEEVVIDEGKFENIKPLGVFISIAFIFVTSLRMSNSSVF